MSYIYSIVYQPQDAEARPTSQFNRVVIQHANLIADYGIEGDRKAGRNPNRNINIMSYDTLLRLSQQGYKTNPGEMGEQIIIDGLDFALLKSGDHLMLGDEAVVEVSFPRTSCRRLEQIQNQVDPSDDYDLGIFVRVVASGKVSVGDRVMAVKNPELVIEIP